jgi:hypothetical protein
MIPSLKICEYTEQLRQGGLLRTRAVSNSSLLALVSNIILAAVGHQCY